jgi:predicted transcriptional regulator
VRKAKQDHLSRREREILDIVYQLGDASVADVEERMEDSPGYDSVRVTLGILTKKGHLGFRKEGRRYIYSPTLSHGPASRAAFQRLVRVFFKGSASRAILAMLDLSSERLSRKDLDQIAKRLKQEKKP